MNKRTPGAFAWSAESRVSCRQPEELKKVRVFALGAVKYPINVSMLSRSTAVLTNSMQVGGGPQLPLT